LRGERVWQAHRQHYYQRLILSGWSHRRTALSEFALMTLCAAVALTCLDRSVATQVIALGALALVLVLAMRMVDRRWARSAAGANA
jgi:hypothetical protein